MTKTDQRSDQPYGLTLDRRQRAEITGVEDVESFDEGSVVLHTRGGRLVLTGSGLHVSSLQLESGRLTLDGSIDGAVYEGSGAKKRGFFRRALG